MGGIPEPTETTVKELRNDKAVPDPAWKLGVLLQPIMVLAFRTLNLNNVALEHRASFLIESYVSNSHIDPFWQ